MDENKDTVRTAVGPPFANMELSGLIAIVAVVPFSVNMTGKNQLVKNARVWAAANTGGCALTVESVAVRRYASMTECGSSVKSAMVLVFVNMNAPNHLARRVGHVEPSYGPGSRQKKLLKWGIRLIVNFQIVGFDLQLADNSSCVAITRIQKNI